MSGLDLLISQNALWYMLLVAVLTGALFGVLCDGLFIIRLFFREPYATGTPRRSVGYAVFRGVCDFLAVISATVLLLLLCYYTSDGQLRAPAVIGMIVGLWAYRKTVSRLVRKLLTAFLNAICRCLRYLWRKTFGRLIDTVVQMVVRRHRNTVTERRVQALTADAAHGFGIRDDSKQG